MTGFITGEEPEEENYFHFSATLRIHGEDIPFDEISKRFGVQPTISHGKRERRRPESKHSYWDDAWHLQSTLTETEPLEKHIAAIWEIVKPEAEYLKSLKSRFNLSVFCGYRSNCDHAGFYISHEALEMFTALEIPFGVSVIVIVI